MIRSEAVGIIARRVGSASPMMLRTKNNLILTFTREEAMDLIREISTAFEGGDVEKIWMHIEFDDGMFYPAKFNENGEPLDGETQGR